MLWSSGAEYLDDFRNPQGFISFIQKQNTYSSVEHAMTVTAASQGTSDITGTLVDGNQFLVSGYRVSGNIFYIRGYYINGRVVLMDWEYPKGATQYNKALEHAVAVAKVS